MDTRPSSAYHSPALTRLNAYLSKRQADQPEGKFGYTRDALLAEARRQTGLERFGDPGFIAALDMTVKVFDSDTLNPFGRERERSSILQSLKNLLWAEHCFATHPEILQRELAPPIIILGLARTGTTRLYRMLAADARLQYLSLWEGINPAPRPELQGQGRSVRIREMSESIKAIHLLAPAIGAIHPMEASWADDDAVLLSHWFAQPTVERFFHSPGYYDWLVSADRLGAYRNMRNLMKLMDWAREESGEAGGKTWVLKAPDYLLDIGLLQQVFPGAKLVFTHRDPVAAIASGMSLAWNINVLSSDAPCRAACRDFTLRRSEDMMRCLISDRKEIPPGQQIDVYYDDVNRDWQAQLSRIYEFAGIDFTSEARRDIASWTERSRNENRHGGHRYNLGDYDCSKQEVEERMRFYSDHYAVSAEMELK